MQRGRRKRKSFGSRLYTFFATTLFVGIVFLSGLLLFYVQEIEVTGNEYSSEKEILNIVWQDSLASNSLYTWCKFKVGAYEKPEYLEDIEVSLKAPWKLSVHVLEKPIAGCCIADGEYVYFDTEGKVLFKSQELKNEMSVVEGIQATGVNLYEKIPMENEKVFGYIANLARELKAAELVADRIVWETDSMNAYFGGVCVRFGKSGFDEKVVQVKAILAELEGKEGVLHLEFYSQNSNRITFEAKKDKKK